MLKDECIIVFKLFGGFSLGQMDNQIFVIVELLNQHLPQSVTEETAVIDLSDFGNVTAADFGTLNTQF